MGMEVTESLMDDWNLLMKLLKLFKVRNTEGSHDGCKDDFTHKTHGGSLLIWEEEFGEEDEIITEIRLRFLMGVLGNDVFFRRLCFGGLMSLHIIVEKPFFLSNCLFTFSQHDYVSHNRNGVVKQRLRYFSIIALT